MSPPLPQDVSFQTALHKLFTEVMSSSHLTEGAMVKRLEAVVEKQMGLYAIAMNSAGSGLFALYRCLNEKKALVPTNTFFATGAMALEAGYAVDLVDTAFNKFSSGLEQYTAHDDVYGIRVLTHVGGKLADDYGEIAKHCKDKNLTLIEDAAHALGVPGVGLLGEAAVFSLYPTKAVPAGEGGIVVTRSPELAHALRVFRNYGKETVDGVITYSKGFNLRMDEWTAAVALLQMERMTDLIVRRQAAADRLMRVATPHSEFREAWSNWYKYPIPKAQYEARGFKKKTGAIYVASDQLTNALFGMPALTNALQIAENHVCLPIGESMYLDKSLDEIEAWLRTA